MRVNQFKRAPVMTGGRWILLMALVILLLAVSFYAYYRDVQTPLWNEQQTAEANAMERGGLKEVTDAYSYAWDEPVWIVEGKDESGKDTYVWLKKEATITLHADEGISKESIKAMHPKPDADIAHIKLGLFGGEPVWEFFYASKQSGQINHYYDFYRFHDGSLIVTYKLPSQ